MNITAIYSTPLADPSKEEIVQWCNDVIAYFQEIVDRNDPHTMPGNAQAAVSVAEMKALRDKFIAKHKNSEANQP